MTTEQTLINELSTARAEFPAGDLRLREPLRRLAAFYCDQRQPHRAGPLVRELWDLHRNASGEADRLAVNSMSWLASIMISSGKVDRAEKLLADFVSRFRKDSRLVPEERAAVMNQLVELYYQQSRFADAIQLCRRCLKLLKRSDTQETSRAEARAAQLKRARNNLGALYVSRGDYQKAERCFVRNLREARKNTAPGDPSYIAQLSNLAALQRLQGKIAESESMTIRAIRQCQRAHGWNHPLVAQGLANLGAYRLQGGRPTSSELLFRKVLQIRRLLHPKGHPQICRARRQLAEAKLALGKHADAERLLERTRASLGGQNPVDEIQLAQTLCSLLDSQ